MIETKGYANHAPDQPLKPYFFQRRKLRPDDVAIEIAYCGICHSDIHTARGEWGPTYYPCVPGHEIVGTVLAVGKKVKRFKAGDTVGVGCFVDSCAKCVHCKRGEEQFCERGPAFTYNSTENDGTTPTFGGYSSHIVVRDRYVLKIKKGQPLERVAPLLCAGITTYSPLKRFGVRKGHRVGVIGLGGLGHMAIKIAKAMGAEVTVFSTSPGKEADAKKLGAKYFVISTRPENLEGLAPFDLMIDSVSVPHDLSPYLQCLKVGGTHVLLGVAPEANQIHAGALIMGRRNLTGSLIGGIRETQEMLDFCASKKIFSDIELISADKINEAFDRTVKAKVKYRFVIDAKTF